MGTPKMTKTDDSSERDRLMLQVLDALYSDLVKIHRAVGFDYRLIEQPYGTFFYWKCTDEMFWHVRRVIQYLLDNRLDETLSVRMDFSGTKDALTELRKTFDKYQVTRRGFSYLDHNLLMEASMEWVTSERGENFHSRLHTDCAKLNHILSPLLDVYKAKVSYGIERVSTIEFEKVRNVVSSGRSIVNLTGALSNALVGISNSQNNRLTVLVKSVDTLIESGRLEDTKIIESMKALMTLERNSFDELHINSTPYRFIVSHHKKVAEWLDEYLALNDHNFESVREDFDKDIKTIIDKIDNNVKLFNEHIKGNKTFMIDVLRDVNGMLN